KESLLARQPANSNTTENIHQLLFMSHLRLKLVRVGFNAKMQCAALQTDPLPSDVAKANDARQLGDRLGKLADVVVITRQFNVERKLVEEILAQFFPPIDAGKGEIVFQ